MSAVGVYRLLPFTYIHVLDNNSGVSRVEVGPLTFTRQEHEKVILGPEKMVKIPPLHYCEIHNPVVRGPDGEITFDTHGNVKLQHGDKEIRFSQDPFPLYPGECLPGDVTPLQVVQPDSAILLRAERDFDVKEDEKHLYQGKSKVMAGDEWLFRGPGTYVPRVEVSQVETIFAIVIQPNEALRLRAKKECVDQVYNLPRKAGEEWLVKRVGAYIPEVDEHVVETISAHVLTDQKALHIRALRSFEDEFGVKRKAGEEWLVTRDMCETHIPDVYEVVVDEVDLKTLTNRQYCVVIDPVDENGKNLYGQKELRVGECSFFLKPGETLLQGILDVFILDEQEALLLRATESFKDETVDGEAVSRKPGDRWMVHGPRDYVPPVQVDVIERRRILPLDQNEGVYVRDIATGRVRSVCGQSYLLKANEELWEKVLPDAVEELLAAHRGVHVDTFDGSDPSYGRDKTRIVTYRVENNTAVQIYDYKKKQSRTVFGPELVKLDPDEHFTILSLSGSTPKRPHVIKCLALRLGPDFMTDVVTVETADHARLQLKLSYNWQFEVPTESRNNGSSKVFQVPDFVGDACKAIASRVRGAVAATSFDEFHKRSARVIRVAVFGTSDGTMEGKVNDRFHFPTNDLVITNIDIQSVEPVDQRTRDALQKSVQLAIEITTKSQEAHAKHEAERSEQIARGRLGRQRLADESAVESARTELLKLRATSASVETTGQAKAEARARAKAAFIEAEAEVKQAELRAEAYRIKQESELKQKKMRMDVELTHKKAMSQMEIEKEKALAEIEANKFEQLVQAIGADTIAAIARAGPEAKAKLLSGLGLQSMMITDGNSPINLFNAAEGLLGGGTDLRGGKHIMQTGNVKKNAARNTETFENDWEEDSDV